jgi:hypothetical protein
MSIYGVSNPYGALRPTPADPRTRGVGERPAPTAAPAATPTPALRDPQAAASAAQALPATPPPGTDPELWAVLSTEERAFFAKVGTMGPLTYGRMMEAARPAVPAFRGGRLDVRG